MYCIEYEFDVCDGYRWLNSDECEEICHTEYYTYEIPTQEKVKAVTTKYAKDNGISYDEAWDKIDEMTDEEYEEEFSEFLKDYFRRDAKEKWLESRNG